MKSPKTLLPLMFCLLPASPFFLCSHSTAQEGASTLDAYALEGDLRKRFLSLSEQLKRAHGVDVNRIVGYRAKRFIESEVIEKIASSGEKIVPWDIYEPKPITWNEWEKGAEFTSKEGEFYRQLVEKGYQWDIEDVQKIHAAAITPRLMGWKHVIFKGAGPGKLRSNPVIPTSGCKVSFKHKIDGEKLQFFKDYDLFVTEKGAGKGAAKEKKVNFITPRIRKKVAPDGLEYYVGRLKYLPNRYVVKALRQLLERVNRDWPRYIAGEKLAISPLEFVADVQRTYIAIHPFGDGNGRSSRFIQDILLQSMGLPYAASGSLGQDFFLSPQDYRQLFKQEMIKQVEFLEGCLEKYNQGGPLGPLCVQLGVQLDETISP